MDLDNYLDSPELLNTIHVGICTSGRWELIEECLHSIMLQDIDRHHLQILLPLTRYDFKSFDSRLEEFRGLQIQKLEVEDYQASVIRNLFLSKVSSGILYFLDEDCSLPTPLHLKNLVAYHKAFPKVTFIGGRYQNSEMTTTFGRAYNLVCDLWQDRNDFFTQSKRLKHLVGGNLSLKLSRQTRAFRFGTELHFGGEEISYLKQAQSSGFKAMLVNGLTVSHHAQHNPKTFFSRAWLHGNNKFFLEKENFGTLMRDRQLIFKKNASLDELGLAACYLGVVQASYYRCQLRSDISSVPLRQLTKRMVQTVRAFR